MDKIGLIASILSIIVSIGGAFSLVSNIKARVTSLEKRIKHLEEKEEKSVDARIKLIERVSKIEGKLNV